MPRNIAIGLALMLLLCQCTRATPEQQLRRTLAELQSGIEARDPNPIKRVLAENFVGPNGLDRSGALRMAQLTFLQHRDVGARIGPLQIVWFPTQAAPDHAAVRFTAMLTGGSGALLPDSAQVYQVTTGWRREGDVWLLTSANWTD